MVLLLAAPSVFAQVDPVLRVQVEPRSVRVGEALSLRVTVLVPTYFARPPVYPDFEVANAITRLPPDSSYPTSDRIAGESWSGIVREYRIFPLAAADYRIRGATMRVAYANPGAASVVRDVPVPDIVFRGIVPAGAESLDPYIAGSALELTLDVEGNDGELAVGDAVVLTYGATLAGLPSMFLPALSTGIENVAGEGAVTVYADAARFGDDDAIATRTERVTLVFHAGGEFSVPAVAIDYWNTTAEALSTARTEPLLLSVAGAPAARQAAADTAGKQPRRWRFALIVGAFLLGLGVALRAWWPVLRERLSRWRASEAYAFRRLRRELGAQGEGEAYRHVQRWLERLGPGLGPRAFAATYGDSALRADVEALSDRAFGGQGREVDLRGFEARLVAARHRYLRRRGVAGEKVLAPLNP
jgi:hypothetical protein